MKYRLGIDLGGTFAKIGIVNDRKKIVRETSVRTSGFPKVSLVAKQLAQACFYLTKGKRISRVGVGVAGDINFEKGIVRISPNLGWKNVPLKSLLSRSLHCPVVVDNDANVAAWGLYNTQTPKNVKHMITVTLGTGVGGGIILNGQVHRGATGSAGEIGHMIMREKDRTCNCGNVGCLETFVGGLHLKYRVRDALKRGRRSQLQTLYRQEPHKITPFTIAKAAHRGDRYALSVWEHLGHMLGVALGNLIYVFNPEMIFLTGGVAKAGNLILHPLWKTLKTRAFKVPIRTVKIKVAKDATHVGVIGASLL